jgi:RNAse (barnase) inhibitor barstar
MKIFINWDEINSFDDFFDIFLPQVKAPDWHGRNMNALSDSIVTGDVNKIEPPFCVISTGVDNMAPCAKEVYSAVSEIFKEANDAGRKIRVLNE